MIYMDRGWKSDLWRFIKRIYNQNALLKAAVLAVMLPYFVVRGLLHDLIRLRNPLARYTEYDQNRGMSRFRDWVDWLGGYPYEVASREEVVGFLQARGFKIARERYQEYVFERT
jgi:2-polyprenyl-6-hydroxyphenyl methylase/3-demethylubiquinone-9 3-methyltransferase